MNTSARLLAFVLLTACGAQPTAGLNSTSSASQKNAELSDTPRAGDILLVPLNCYVCNAIESETGTPYSHAVVVGNSTENPEERFVYEAWGEIKTTTFNEILKRKQKNQDLYLLRAKEFISGVSPSTEDLRAVFENKFKGLPFDDEYLWSNRDQSGNEKIYCTEFVIKFINTWLTRKQKPQPMSFNKNFDFWTVYYKQFQMQPPTGKLGASPATLFHSELFTHPGKPENF